jgi:nucleoside-diphosphate-sugar epimerase
MGRVNAWTATDRIRRDGTRNLVDACLAAGVTTFVYPSIVLVYADAGDQWIDADCGVLDPPPHARSTLDAETEVHRISAAGGRGLSLRLGLLYSPHDEVTAMQLSMARRGIGSAVGPDEAYWPALWVEDAATAFVAALDAPAGVYDLVDDRPLTRAELHQAMAAAVGRRLWRLPRPLQPLLTGQLTASLSRSLRVSNRRFREVTGWRPSVPDAAAGWQRIVRPG